MNSGETDEQTETDYRIVYPILYRSLTGYGIPESAKDLAPGHKKGPVRIQIRALHELYVSALRAGYHDAAIRHLCYLLEVYIEDFDLAFTQQLCNELSRLCQQRADRDLHRTNVPLNVVQANISLAPLPMSRFPIISGFQLMPLPTEMAPRVIKDDDKDDGPFIYAPFQKRKPDTLRWVVDCACGVTVKVKNCLPFELRVCNLALQTEGAAFEAVPVQLDLPPASPTTDPSQIQLLGYPRSSGLLRLVGYTCETLNVSNACSLSDLPWMSGTKLSDFEVEVLPSLPLLQLNTSLKRAPTSNDTQVATAETTVYSGQSFEHSVRLTNTSTDMAITQIELNLKQPNVCGGPQLVTLIDQSATEGSLQPLETKELRFRIFGVDPMAATNEMGQQKAKGPTIADSSIELIPYTGRLLTAEFEFRYRTAIGVQKNQVFERTGRLPLAVNIVPAVTVLDWHVLPGDGPSTRYVVLDLTNCTESEALLNLASDRYIGVQPREVCRVPLLCPCCETVTASAFAVAEESRSLMMQVQELDKLRKSLELHVASHLDIVWSIPQLKLQGLVPIGPMLSSISLLKQLVLPALSINLTVNDRPNHGPEEIPVGIGELVDIHLELTTSLQDGREINGWLELSCFQEMQNGRPSIDRLNDMIICGPVKQPFQLISRKVGEEDRKSDYAPRAPPSLPSIAYNLVVAFRHEGIFKVAPVLNIDSKTDDQHMFLPVLSFNVSTKNL